MVWRYVGEGRFYPGIPAQDLTDDEAREYGVDKLPIDHYPALYKHEKDKAPEKAKKERI